MTISLNPRQPSEAQIMAALEYIGGDAAITLKMLALRGILSDPSLACTFTRGIKLAGNTRKAKGNGWKASAKKLNTSHFPTAITHTTGSPLQQNPASKQEMLSPSAPVVVSLHN